MACLLIPLCLFLVGLQITHEKKEKYYAATVLKGLASLCFVLLGVMLPHGGEMARLIVLGLILGAVADVLLSARYAFAEKGQILFLTGILVFLSGHIAYLAALLKRSEHPLLCITIGIVLTALLMTWIFTKITAKKVFRIFGIFYVGAIMVMNCVAVGNLIASPGLFTGLFTTGAVLFLLSDIILILNTFGSESRFSRRILNLVLYYIGQLLIAGSLFFLA